MTILERNPSKDYLSPAISPQLSFESEDRIASTFTRRCRSASPPKDQFRPKSRPGLPRGPVRPKRTKTYTDDDFTGIVGSDSANNISYHSDSDEDLDFYKEKYSKLLEQNVKTTLQTNDSDSEDPFEKLSGFNFIPSFRL